MNRRDAEGAEKGRADTPVRPYGDPDYRKSDLTLTIPGEIVDAWREFERKRSEHASDSYEAGVRLQGLVIDFVGDDPLMEDAIPQIIEAMSCCLEHKPELNNWRPF